MVMIHIIQVKIAQDGKVVEMLDGCPTIRYVASM